MENNRATPRRHGPVIPRVSDDAQTLLDALEHPAFVTDDAGRIVFGNRAAKRAFPERPGLDSTFAGMRFHQPFDTWHEALVGVFESGASREWRNAVLQPVSGTGSVWDVRACALRPNDAATSALALITLRDVCDRAALEHQAAMHERLASVGKLAARVAHELNNPLDGILRYLNLSLKLLPAQAASWSSGPRSRSDEAGVPGRDSDSRLRPYLEEARNGVKRMAGIVRDLLEFSRGGEGVFDAATADEVVEQAVRAVSPRADELGVILAVDLQQRDMPAVSAGALRQVCANLLSNALDAMPGGGRLTVSLSKVAGQLLLRVADTGCGLPPESNRIFEPFFTTKPPGVGTGLGLAICKELVERMGGSIEATHADEAGAVFNVRIPFPPAATEEPRS